MDKISLITHLNLIQCGDDPILQVLQSDPGVIREELVDVGGWEVVVVGGGEDLMKFVFCDVVMLCVRQMVKGEVIK